MKKILLISLTILLLFTISEVTAYSHYPADGTTIFECGEIIGIGTNYYYTLNQSIIADSNPCIVVDASNIIINLNGFNITGNPSRSDGIFLAGRTNITIYNGSIYNFWNAISLYVPGDTNSLFANLTLSGNFYQGVYSLFSNNNRFQNINASNNVNHGLYLYASNNNSIQDTVTNYNPAYAGIELFSSNNNTMLNITSNNNGYGVYIGSSTKNNITNAILNNNYYGLASYGGLLTYSYFENIFLNKDGIYSGSPEYGISLSSSYSTLKNITTNGSKSSFSLSGSNNNLSNIVSSYITDCLRDILSIVGSNNTLKNVSSHDNSCENSIYLEGNNNLFDWINMTSNSVSSLGEVLTINGSNNGLNNLTLYGCASWESDVLSIYNSNNTLSNLTTWYNSGSTGDDGVISLYGEGNFLQDIFMHNDTQPSGLKVMSSNNQITNFNSNYYKGLYGSIVLFDNGGNNTFIAGFINNSLGKDFDLSGNAIFFKSSASNLDNNTFYDYSIKNSLFKDLYFATFLTKNITNQIFINSTFSLDKIYYNNHSSAGGLMNLIKKWYFDTNITNTFKLPLENVNITAYNLNSSFIFSLLTNSTGNIPRQYLTEYTYDGSSVAYQTPNTLITNESNYRLSTLFYNLTAVGNIFHNIILSPNLHVVLESPLNETTWQTPIKFNCSSYSTLTDLTNITLQIWNSSALYYNETKTVSGLSNSSNFSVDFTYDDTFKYNCLVYNNNSDYDFESNKTFYVSLTSPAVTINNPVDNAYLNNHIFYINFTAIDSNGLDTCRLMNNKTVDWLVNYTWIKPTNATMNYTILNLSDGGWDYNLGCNDTNNNVGWASTSKNYHLTVDTVNPNNTINSVSVTTGYQNVIVSSTQTDVNLANCSYSIFNSSGGIDGTNRNISFTCNTNFIATVTQLGTFNLSTSARDLANNENLTYIPFTIKSSVPISQTAGEKTVIINKTHCGDLVCQNSKTGFPHGNDYNIQEDQYTCAQDCPLEFGQHLDEWVAMLFGNCFDKNADGTPNLNTKCFWTQQLFSIGGNINQTNFVCGDGTCNGNEFYSTCKEDCGTFQWLDSLAVSCVAPSRTPTTTCYFSTNLGVYTLFGALILVFIVASIRIPSEGKGSQKVNIIRYAQYKTKSYRKRKKRY